MRTKVIVPKREEAVSAQREILMQNILDKDERVIYVQRMSASICEIEAESVERDSATVRLRFFEGREWLIFYRLTPEENGECELKVTTFWSTHHVETRYPYVWLLCRHRACKAMLRERNRHRGHVKKLRKTKESRELARAA